MHSIDPAQLEAELQAAFTRGEFNRLHRFATWCAEQTVHPRMPASWQAGLALARRRADGLIAEDAFRTERDALMAHLPVAATCIGLRHGAPNAASLLAIAGALSDGALSAARSASRNQRLYAVLRAQAAAGRPTNNRQVAVDLQRAEQVAAAACAGMPDRAEVDCLSDQWKAWRRSASDGGV